VAQWLQGAKLGEGRKEVFDGLQRFSEGVWRAGSWEEAANQGTTSYLPKWPVGFFFLRTEEAEILCVGTKRNGKFGQHIKEGVRGGGPWFWETRSAGKIGETMKDNGLKTGKFERL